MPGGRGANGLGSAGNVNGSEPSTPIQERQNEPPSSSTVETPMGTFELHHREGSQENPDIPGERGPFVQEEAWTAPPPHDEYLNAARNAPPPIFETGAHLDRPVSDTPLELVYLKAVTLERQKNRLQNQLGELQDQLRAVNDSRERRGARLLQAAQNTSTLEQNILTLQEEINTLRQNQRADWCQATIGNSLKVGGVGLIALGTFAAGREVDASDSSIWSKASQGGAVVPAVLITMGAISIAVGEVIENPNLFRRIQSNSQWLYDRARSILSGGTNPDNLPPAISLQNMPPNP